MIFDAYAADAVHVQELIIINNSKNVQCNNCTEIHENKVTLATLCPKKRITLAKTKSHFLVKSFIFFQ